VDVVLDEHAQAALGDVGLFCRCTKTVKCARFFYRQSQGSPFLNMYALFDTGSFHPFSEKVKDVQFFFCDFLDYDGSLVEHAATALRDVEFLRLGSCRFPAILRLLERLPRLKTLSCMARCKYILHDLGSIDGGKNFVDAQCANRQMQDNDDLQKLCRLIKRQESALDDIELDLVGWGAEERDIARPYVAYPAINELLSCCKGRLSLNCVALPWESHLHILGGLGHLGKDLRELRIRFHDCQLGDKDYAAILRALRSNETLISVEIGFGDGAALASIAAIQDLVETNKTSQVLSLRGIGSDAALVLAHILPALTETNRSLRVLKLFKANMTGRWPDTLGPMKDMLQVNHVFSSLVGCTLPKGNADASKIRRLLKLNWFGRRFWTAEDLPTKTIWATVLGRISKHKDHQMMYKFLRAKRTGDPPFAASASAPMMRMPTIKRSNRELPSTGGRHHDYAGVH
jgi:hypothetical protein